MMKVHTRCISAWVRLGNCRGNQGRFSEESRSAVDQGGESKCLDRESRGVISSQLSSMDNGVDIWTLSASLAGRGGGLVKCLNTLGGGVMVIWLFCCPWDLLCQLTPPFHPFPSQCPNLKPGSGPYSLLLSFPYPICQQIFHFYCLSHEFVLFLSLSEVLITIEWIGFLGFFWISFLIGILSFPFTPLKSIFKYLLEWSF